MCTCLRPCLSLTLCFGCRYFFSMCTCLRLCLSLSLCLCFGRRPFSPIRCTCLRHGLSLCRGGRYFSCSKYTCSHLCLRLSLCPSFGRRPFSLIRCTCLRHGLSLCRGARYFFFQKCTSKQPTEDIFIHLPSVTEFHQRTCTLAVAYIANERHRRCADYCRTQSDHVAGGSIRLQQPLECTLTLRYRYR